jgi:DNA-binding HxlR family transcriptional regulator
MRTIKRPTASDAVEGCGGAHEGQAEIMARTLRLIGDRWVLLIIYNLMAGAKRFGELLDGLGNVSPKTLSQRLKMLEEVQIVSRQAFAEIPPRVEYQLTEKGLALLNVLNAVQEFGMRYLADEQTAVLTETVPEA